MRWLKQDLSTLAMSLSNTEYKKTGVINPAWITSCSLQPRISIVRQSARKVFEKMGIMQVLAGDNDFGPLLSTLAVNYGELVV